VGTKTERGRSFQIRAKCQQRTHESEGCGDQEAQRAVGTRSHRGLWGSGGSDSHLQRRVLVQRGGEGGHA